MFVELRVQKRFQGGRSHHSLWSPGRISRLGRSFTRSRDYDAMGECEYHCPWQDGIGYGLGVIGVSFGGGGQVLKWARPSCKIFHHPERGFLNGTHVV